MEKRMIRKTAQGDNYNDKLSEKALRLLAAHDREVESRSMKSTTPAAA